MTEQVRADEASSGIFAAMGEMPPEIGLVDWTGAEDARAERDAQDQGRRLEEPKPRAHSSRYRSGPRLNKGKPRNLAS